MKRVAEIMLHLCVFYLHPIHTIIIQTLSTMSLNTYTDRMAKLDRMISRKMTGTPERCAERIGTSERTLYDMLDQMRILFDSPIEYCRERQTYYYVNSGRLNLEFVGE
jgi:hypothetical protein